MSSIRVHLFALVAICLILAASAFGAVIARTDDLNRQQAQTQTRETARALSQAVDRELERGIGVLAALSASEAAASHDWASLDRQARAALREQDAWVVVQDRSGRQHVNTRLPFGSPLPAGPPPAEMWNAISDGKTRVCNLTQGLVEKTIVCVDSPIGSGSRPEYAISLILLPRAFGSIITRENVAAGNIATLIDRSNRVIWRNIKADQFVGKQATGEMLKALVSGAPSGELVSTSLEGVEMLSAFNRSSLSGWSVIVGSPLEQVDTISREAIWRGSLLALSIFFVGCVFALLLGARLVSAVNALVSATEAEAEHRPVKRTGISEIDAVAEALARSFAAKAESERHQQLLVGELNHRVKNTLSIVQSLARQTFRGHQSPADAIHAFEARLQALAAAHNLLTKQRWESASMVEIIRTALAPFCDERRCRLDGPDLQLTPQTAVSLALALHELGTNASKYGALSNDDGQVEVTWTSGEGDFLLLWQESGGPPVKAPTSEGFGMRLIKRSLASELRGKVEVEFPRTGVCCRVTGKLG